MWDEIKKNGIIERHTSAQGDFISSIPEGTASLAAARLIKMMQWIYDEFKLDSSANPNIFQSGYLNEEEAFVTRNTSRVLSYANHVCVLEHILVKLYDETIAKLQVIDPSILSDSVALDKRKKEVKNCFTFRNKVSAHTAYGSPRKDDNLSMEFQSLTTLLSSSFDKSGQADSFALGAVSVQFAGDPPSTKLPCLGLKKLHPEMLTHIEEWKGMLITPCIVARKKLPVTIGDTEYRV